MSDEVGFTPKVICVPSADPRQAHLRDIADLDEFLRLEIQHFFEIYKAIEPGKRVEFGGQRWAGRAEAEAEITAAYARVRSTR